MKKYYLCTINNHASHSIMKKNLLALATLILTLSTAFAATPQADTLLISSKYMEPAVKVIVVKPADYDAKVAQGKRFPSVYLLHGYSDDYRCWPTKTQPALDSLATHWGMIFICPDGRDSWYFDAVDNPKMQVESFITRDLVPYVDNNYATIPAPGQRAITGLSMGGHGAMWLAFRHSDIWGNAGSTSGGVNFAALPQYMHTWKIDRAIGNNPDDWKSHTALSLVPTLKPGSVNIIFDCGVDDFFAATNDEFHQALLKAKIPHDYISRPGSHTHEYWRNAILFQLQYFNEKFKNNSSK